MEILQVVDIMSLLIKHYEIFDFILKYYKDIWLKAYKLVLLYKFTFRVSGTI